LEIPSPRSCSPRRRRNRSRHYCGNRTVLPQGYSRRGSRYECLRTGFGAGMCSIYHQ
jgi:hypothetical protein